MGGRGRRDTTALYSVDRVSGRGRGGEEWEKSTHTYMRSLPSSRVFSEAVETAWLYSFSQCSFLAWASSRSFCSLEMVLCCSMITSSISSRNDAMLRRNVSSMAERSFSLHRSCCGEREAWVNHGRDGFRLRAVIYHILPPATAMVDYALGREASFLQPLP